MKLQRITIKQLSTLGRQRVLDYDGRLMIVDHIAQEYLFEEPCRIDAVLILVCIRGRLDYTVNLEHNVVTESSILVNMPENIIQLRGSENLEAYAVLVSTELIKSMQFDMGQLGVTEMPFKQHFYATVPLEQIVPLIPYYELICHSLSHVVPETEMIVKGLLQAFLCNISSLMQRHQMSVMDVDHTATRSSRLLYERFKELLATHYKQERTVQFYADKLCITAKYLSTAIKEYSGRSPSDWICEYVIAEAKSMLHYSELSVQEVAFRLNFPSQSAFGKFFKQRTGLSPMQYAKGEEIGHTPDYLP